MDLYTILITLHLMGFAFGLGGATASDMVFVRSTSGGKVSKDSYKIIKTLSILVWTSVALLIVSGASLMLLELSRLGEVPRLEWSFFQLKVLAFSFLVVNGIVFHKYVFPYLGTTVGKSFHAKAVREKYPMFAFTGAVSIVSWYTAFFMVAFSRFFIDYSFTLLVTGYFMLISIAAIGAYLMLNWEAEKRDTNKTIEFARKNQFVQLMLFSAVGFFALLLVQLYFLYLESSAELTMLINGVMGMHI